MKCTQCSIFSDEYMRDQNQDQVGLGLGLTSLELVLTKNLQSGLGPVFFSKLRPRRLNQVLDCKTNNSLSHHLLLTKFYHPFRVFIRIIFKIVTLLQGDFVRVEIEVN